MKQYYESRFKVKLPRRNYTIIRIDGKAFHTYTRGMIKPFDYLFMQRMDQTAAYLCKEIMGAKLAFVQSDEISILLTDFDTLQTQAWFDYEVDKMVSVAAGEASGHFNTLVLKEMFHSTPAGILTYKHAAFDARVFQLPNAMEVLNYFLWRQRDATVNSISSVAQTLYSAKELHKKSTDEMQEMIFQRGINWNDYPAGAKRGRLIIKEEYTHEESGATRTRWVTKDLGIFGQGIYGLPTNESDRIENHIPNFFLERPLSPKKLSAITELLNE